MSLNPCISPSAEIKITRGHSCILCRRRKIRCDGQHPCHNCIKAGADCAAPEIVPARRRKRKQDNLVARLRQCEEIISKAGLKIEDVDEETDTGDLHSDRELSVMDVGAGRSHVEGGKLIAEKGQSRYFENSIWEKISAEVREDSIHLLQRSSEDDVVKSATSIPDHSSLIFDRLMVSSSLTSSHPPPVQIFRLWQVFIENVNPLTKVLHAPTVQQQILQASGDLEEVSASMEALMFAIYHSAAVSLDDQQCQNLLGESRPDILAKYSAATQQALVNSKVLRTSNLMVLQALTLYLLSIRQSSDPDSLWILSGIATRIGIRMGLHHESVTQKISILEGEIRRRLWWQILALEGHSSGVSGSASPTSILSLRPGRNFLNVNDSDLTPSMRETPIEHHAITEMLFCCIQYEIGLFMFSHVLFSEASIAPLPRPSDSIQTKLKAIDELEARLREKYLRYVDESVPLHFHATIVVRSALCKLRFRAYAPSRNNTALPQVRAEIDASFALALKILEYDNEGHSPAVQTKLKGFMWHVRVFFQIEAFIYVLSELRLRTIGEQVDRAWWLVEVSYAHHEDMLRDTKNKVWFAVGNLCLKAWEQRAKGLRGQQGVTYLVPPAYVQELYAQRGIKGSPGGETGAEFVEASMELPGQTNMQMLQEDQSIGDQRRDAILPSTYMPFSAENMEPMDWDYWQILLDDCGLPPSNR